MMKLAEETPVDESMKSKLLPVCLLPSVLDNKHAEPHLIEECTKASVASRGKDEDMARAQKQGCNPAFGRVRMQASDMCLQNFVIFDQSDGQNTMILHPSWLQGLPRQSSPEPGSIREANCFLESLQAFNSKSMDAMFGIHSSAGLCPASRDQPALQAQQKSNAQNCSPIGPVNCKAYNFEKQVGGSSPHLGDEQESLGDFHENTEEINALLSSDDDELSSTGHSPSDGASVGLSLTINGFGTNISGKKRKLDDPPADEMDDADSGSCQSSSRYAPLESRRYGSSSSLHFPGLGCGNASGESEMSSILHASKQVVASEGKPEFKQGSEMLSDGGLINSSKRIKIKSNLQQLKNVIPGGNLMDTLDRTIHYVKCLQKKQRGSEAARESTRVMHQIG